MIAARDLLCAYVARRHVSERELAECWGITSKLVHDKLHGEAPIHLGEILALPRRISLELLDDIRRAVLEHPVTSTSSHR